MPASRVSTQMDADSSSTCRSMGPSTSVPSRACAFIARPSHTGSPGDQLPASARARKGPVHAAAGQVVAAAWRPVHRGAGAASPGRGGCNRCRRDLGRVRAPRSQRSRAQFDDYRWQKLHDGTVTDRPVKLEDDAPDAGRYAAFTHYNRPAATGGLLVGWR